MELYSFPEIINSLDLGSFIVPKASSPLKHEEKDVNVNSLASIKRLFIKRKRSLTFFNLYGASLIENYAQPCSGWRTTLTLPAGSRSKNSATNQKRAYGVGTDLVRTGYARIRPGILWGHTHDVWS